MEPLGRPRHRWEYINIDLKKWGVGWFICLVLVLPCELVDQYGVGWGPQTGLSFEGSGLRCYILNGECIERQSASE